MKNSILVVMLAIVLFSTVAHAEVIYLKNGNIIKGKIVSDDINGVTVQNGKKYEKYYKSQIDRIERSGTVETIDLKRIDMSQFKWITPHKVAQIVNLIQINGTKRVLEGNISKAIANAPLADREEFKRVFRVNGIVEKLIPIYDEYFSGEELDEIISFYNTPAGLKVVDVTPKITRKTIKAIVNYFKENASK